MLADEPTAALDKKSGRDVVEIMQKLAKEQACTILLVTHDNRILDIADRIIYMEDRRLAENPNAASALRRKRAVSLSNQWATFISPFERFSQRAPRTLRKRLVEISNEVQEALLKLFNRNKAGPLCAAFQNEAGVLRVAECALVHEAQRPPANDFLFGQRRKHVAGCCPMQLRVTPVVERFELGAEHTVVVLGHLPRGEDLVFAFGMGGTLCFVVRGQAFEATHVRELEGSFHDHFRHSRQFCGADLNARDAQVPGRRSIECGQGGEGGGIVHRGEVHAVPVAAPKADGLGLEVQDGRSVGQDLAERAVENRGGLDVGFVQPLGELVAQVEVAVFADGTFGEVAAKIGRDEAGHFGRHRCFKESGLRLDDHVTQALKRRNDASCSFERAGEVRDARHLDFDDFDALLPEFFQLILCGSGAHDSTHVSALLDQGGHDAPSKVARRSCYCDSGIHLHSTCDV